MPCLQDWIKIQFKNLHTNLTNTSDGAQLFYNLEDKTKNRRLEPRLPRNFFLADSTEDEDEYQS